MRGSEPQRLLAAEIAADAARVAASRREQRRHQGACWSGMAPEPFVPRSPDQLQTCVQERLAARQAWREGPDGGFVSAIASCQAASKEAFTLAERARAGAARGEPTEWRRRVAEELALHARALLAAAKHARLAASGD